MKEGHFSALVPLSPHAQASASGRERCLGLNRQRQKPAQVISSAVSQEMQVRDGEIQRAKRRWPVNAVSLRRLPLGTLGAQSHWEPSERWCGAHLRFIPLRVKRSWDIYLAVLNSHWLMFLTGNIYSSAFLVYPSLHASCWRKPLGRGSQMFKWEMFNESADYLPEG